MISDFRRYSTGDQNNPSSSFRLQKILSLTQEIKKYELQIEKIKKILAEKKKALKQLQVRNLSLVTAENLDECDVKQHLFCIKGKIYSINSNRISLSTDSLELQGKFGDLLDVMKKKIEELWKKIQESQKLKNKKEVARLKMTLKVLLIQEKRDCKVVESKFLKSDRSWVENRLESYSS